MSARGTVVIGVGNRYRRDDAAGPTVIDLLEGRAPQGVRLVACDGDPVTLLECWSNAELAVVVDALRRPPGTPGRIHRTDLARYLGASTAGTSSHGLGLLEAFALARALDRAPSRLIAYLVEAGDVGYGPELSPAVRETLPRVVQAVLTELGVTDRIE